MQTFRFRRRTLVALWLTALAAPFDGAASAAAPPIGDLQRAWRDDADLTSVAFVDPLTGWAVGDHGVVLHTDDGGKHWTPQESGVDCRLRSVCFLDRRNGWIAGGYYDRYVHRSRGVVLRTADGGATWQQEPTALLPALRRLHMTSPTEGWAVGDATTFYPAGLFLTRDGGKTWNPATGAAPAGLLSADFAGPQRGAFSDRLGRVFPTDGRTSGETPAADFGLRSARRIALRADGAGWLVGDGGLVMRTGDAGATWHAPGGDLSAGAGGQCDWRSVAWRGSHVWIVGRPGSLVLYSPDDGRTWRSHPTGQSLPLADVTFPDETHGYAVGAMGTILATDDGGLTWRRQSYAARRAALWTCFADAEDLPLELLAQAAAEEGYLTSVTLLARRPPDGSSATATDSDRAADAASAVGVSAAQQAWAFPSPDAPLQTAAADLLRVWGDGDEAEGVRRVEAYLVRELRTWRPDVVVTHSPSPRGEAPADHLIHRLVLQAVAAAADPARYSEQIELLGLAPWNVRKVFGHDPRQSQGTVTLKTSQIASRLASSLADFVEPGRALLFDRRIPPPAVSACRLFANRTPHGSAERDLFAGLSLAGGGEARRPTSSLDGETLVRLRKAAERQRNLQAVVLQKKGTAGETLVGQLRDFTAGLDDEHAGRVVFQLAETFRAGGRWEAAREAYEYLLARWPQHADSEAAIRRLVHYLSSDEADFRLRRAMIETTAGVAEAIGAPELLANVESPAAARNADETPRPNPAALVGYTADVERRRRAVALGAYYERRDPAGYAEPTILFPLAAARRRLGQSVEARAFYDHFVGTHPQDAWWECAAGETALHNRAAATVKRMHRSVAAGEKPLLDGRLDDPVWRAAEPLELRARRGGDASATALVAHDAEYLYLAVVCRRSPGAAIPPPTGPRERDADLSLFDRVDFCLDVDRDLAIYYRLSVDCRGWTHDSCWDDDSWDPQWFVAAGGDDERWIVEIAVPWSELTVAPPQPGDVWALGVQRSTPAAGLQSWTVPASPDVRPEGFGYLTFD